MAFDAGAGFPEDFGTAPGRSMIDVANETRCRPAVPVPRGFLADLTLFDSLEVPREPAPDVEDDAFVESPSDPTVADATPAPETMAVPTPNAIAKPPTRPI
jgi:hypothetical protein